METQNSEVKERLGFRVSGDLKHLIEEAASIQALQYQTSLKLQLIVKLPVLFKNTRLFG